MVQQDPEIELIIRTSDFEALREEWNELNDRSEKGTLFSSWEWMYSWWEVYQQDGDRELFVLCCRSGGNLIGIAPFQILNGVRKQFPCTRRLLLLGTGETDGAAVLSEYLDLIIEPGCEPRVLEAFAKVLTEQNQMWQGALFPQLLEGSHLSSLFGNSHDSTETEIRPNGFRCFIELPASYQEYLMTLRKKMRNNITRLQTRLDEEQEYRIESIRDGLDVDSALTDLANLNRARRENLEGSSSFHRPNFEAFHRKVVKRLLPLNRVEIRVMHIGNDAVASLYSLIDGDTVHAYQSGFEAEMGRRYGLLNMMFAREITHCIENPDIVRFNFMFSMDENSYKLRFGGQSEPMFDLSCFPDNLRTRIHHWLHRTAKPLVKRLLGKVDK